MSFTTTLKQAIAASTWFTINGHEIKHKWDFKPEDKKVEYSTLAHGVYKYHTFEDQTIEINDQGEARVMEGVTCYRLDPERTPVPPNNEVLIRFEITRGLQAADVQPAVAPVGKTWVVTSDGLLKAAQVVYIQGEEVQRETIASDASVDEIFRHCTGPLRFKARDGRSWYVPDQLVFVNAEGQTELQLQPSLEEPASTVKVQLRRIVHTNGRQVAVAYLD